MKSHNVSQGKGVSGELTGPGPFHMSTSAFDIESDKSTSTNDIESPITTTHNSKGSQEDNWITVGGKKVRSKT